MIIKNTALNIEDHYTSNNNLFYVSTSYIPNSAFAILIDQKVIGYPHHCTISLEKGECLDYGALFKVDRSDD